MSGSKTMRAIRQDATGGPDVLREVETARPSPRPGEVLIRVRTAGVNPTDWKHRAGSGFLEAPPFVLGWDVCGTVVETGYGVTIHRSGDEVFGMLPYPFGHGSHAEYVVGPARAFVTRPEGVDVLQAGALPLVSLTAWQALVDTAMLGPGQRVLVHAAAGGVGHVAVQIAKSRGAHVIGTASSAKHGFLRELGADEQIDYRETDVAEAVSGMDVVLETIGGEHARESLRVLRPGGTLVSLLPLPQDLPAEAERLGVRTAVMLVEDDQAGMRAVADLAATGRLRATIAETFPLAEAARAHAAGETGRTTGKLVLTVD
ncbi:NADP-dependent oxidoreductase [Streptomyces sp. NPDC005012]|uniref:NADP-dependent oxidoreductase n=1 Tax=unclassified Streptomyces TaxID=2593676 RepID=UPI0033AA0462